MTNLISPQLILRCIRRPIRPEPSKNKSNQLIKVFFVVGIIIQIIIFSAACYFLKVPFDVIKANNQAVNWKNASSIYQFKIEKLDNQFFYLYELKNKAILIVK